MTVAWVVGSGGLLGAALCRALRRGGVELFSPADRLSWTSNAELARQFATAVQAFGSRAAAAGRWELYWAAGVSALNSSETGIEAETQAVSSSPWSPGPNPDEYVWNDFKTTVSQGRLSAI